LADRGARRSVEELLQVARQELLDLGLRNRLINFRPLKGKGLAVVDEISAEVFRILVFEGRTMYFLPTAGGNEAASDDPSLFTLDQPDDATADSGTTARHLDNKLQTPYPAKQLQSRLLSTYYDARLAIEETGVNILYLALGMLRWFEVANSNEPHDAPLILVPIELNRADVRERFRVEWTGDAIGTNLSLKLKLKEEFGINIPDLPSQEDVDVSDYMERVATAVRRQPRWSVDKEAIHLGFFSFSKLLMFADLDPKVWPPHARPGDHEILGALLGEGFGTEHPLPSPRNLDEAGASDALCQVLDADSSQTQAMLRVASGRSVVIQGPPGTGKSQTIVNLIAGALAESKTVLFVAEKMAALEVVKRRLDHIGLGEACLELHSNRSKKKSVLEDLRTTLESAQPIADPLQATSQELSASRERLNAYCKAVNEPINASSVSPFQAYGNLIRLEKRLLGEGEAAASPGAPRLPHLSNEPFREWTLQQFRQRLDDVGELQALISRMGIPAEHAFWGSGRRLFLRADRQTVLDAAVAARESLEGLQAQAEHCAAVLGVPQPDTIDGVRTVLNTIEHAALAPDLAGVNVADPAWAHGARDVESALLAGSAAASLQSRFAGRLVPEAWSRDVGQLRQDIAAVGSRRWRFASPRYWRSRAAIASLCGGQAPKRVEEWTELLGAIREYQSNAAAAQGARGACIHLLGAAWADLASDWQRLLGVHQYLRTVHAQVQAGAVLPEILRAIVRPPSVPWSAAAGPLKAALAGAKAAIESAIAVSETDIERRFRVDDVARISFGALREALERWAREVDRLQEIVTFNHLTEKLTHSCLGALVHIAGTWPLARDQLAALFEHAWYTGLLEAATRTRPELAAFDGAAHQHHLKRFREADRLGLHLNRARLAHAHWEQLPRQGTAGQVGILRAEFAKRRRLKPIRQLVEEAPNAIQAIKPVFMMSPLSVATFLPPGHITFDLLIFDEASQVKPVDAFGAILRGRQAVVVGDSKQLPPTSFFERVGDIDDDEDREEAPVAIDMESVLGLFGARGGQPEMLRWHYRSRHESLIATSNAEFYDNKLVVFPSPDLERTDTGLVMHYLPQTAYERGRGRSFNRGEAQEVAHAVMRHARNNPDQSLGVATFGQGQMQVILDELEILRRGDTSTEGFFASHLEEPFFVKNLENVQGDERDVIFISVGYGKDAAGYVAMNFGPVNQDGGERRLNVLITRARDRCEVFSNITSDDIDLSRSSARGVVALKTFLHYARTRIAEVPLVTGAPADSPFEEEVGEALQEHGYIADRQVGSGGFFLDLAVRDPRKPGRYLVGIECDGASYHSARWARDRDRLRQEVLERLGWSIVRVWSTDWYRNRGQALRQLLTAIEAAKVSSTNKGTSSVAAPSIPVPSVQRQAAVAPPKTPTAIPYTRCVLQVHWPGELHLAPPEILRRWVELVVAAESPVHLDEVVARIRDATGNQRAGSRIRSAVHQAAQAAARSGSIKLSGDFLMLREQRTVAVRDRTTLPPQSRKIELIAREEIQAAILRVAEASRGIAREELVNEVCRAFGFARVTEGMAEHVARQVDSMIRAHSLRSSNGCLLPESPS
jgi:very-short-patch-repair endonuclease